VPIIVVIVLATAILLWLATKEKTSGRIQLCFILCIYAFAIFQYASYTYNPNIFTTDAYHVTAVQTSIYNVAFNTPFTTVNSSIYGHYALFFLPLVKLFGHREIILAIGMTFFAVVSQALLFYSMHKLIRSNVLRAIGACASVVTVAIMRTEAYWQTWPLRILPVSVILAFTVWCYSHDNKMNLKRTTIGYCLCSLCILWVTDFGLGVTLAYSAYLCIWHWQNERVFSPKMVQVYISVVLCFIGAVVGMIVIINIYNLLCGGHIEIQACFYPFIGSGTYIESLQFPILWGNRSWIHITILFTFCLALGLVGKKHAAFFDHPDRLPLVALMAILGFCATSYYYNRAVYFNLDVSLNSAILCMMYLAQIGLHQIRLTQPCIKAGASQIIVKSIFIGLSATCFLSLTSLTLLLLQQWPIALNARMEMYKQDSLNEYSRLVQEAVPADTYAWGLYTQDVYAQLGWDPQYHSKDVADLFGDGLSEVVEELNAQETLLISVDSLTSEIITRESGLKPQKAIPEDIPIFYYYTKDTPFPSACDFTESGNNDLLTLQANATGIVRESETGLFYCKNHVSLTLATSKSSTQGLNLRVSVPHNTSNSGMYEDSFTITVFVNETTVGIITCNIADEKYNYVLEIGSEQMPAPYDDGTYLIGLTTDGTNDVKYYVLEYIGML
jgi:hypothetical protein